MAAEQLRSTGLSRPEQALLNLTRSGYMRLLLALNAGVASYSAVKNAPAVHEMVDDVFLSHFRGDQLTSTDTKPVERFDSDARTGEVKPTMITRISEEQIQELDSFAKVEDGHNTILGVFPIETNTSDNLNANIKFKKQNGDSGDEQNRADRTEKGFLNIVYFEKVPAGSTILAPVDGRLILFTASGNPTPLNDHDFISAVIDFQVEGDEYKMVISGGSTKGGMMNKRADVFRSLTNAPVIGSSQPIDEQLKIRKEKAIPVKNGESILVADTEIDVTIHMMGNLVPTGKKITEAGREWDLAMEEPTNLQFFLSPDGQLVMPE